MSRPPGLLGSSWSLPLGANVVDGGVRFGVWAPKARAVDVEIEAPDGSRSISRSLDRDDGAVFTGLDPTLKAGARYRYRLDGDRRHPDPWSRSQPGGVHGSSEVVDPLDFAWNDFNWPGLTRDGLVVYELHVGAFSPKGTFDAVVEELAALRRLGVTAIELMPVAEFPGARSWGYDGVALFAPSRAYGGVAGLKRLVDAAHHFGLGVILDVVYNHLGPDGNYLGVYSDSYFTDRYHTPWGSAVNYDGPGSERVRELVIHNACYWLVEYHLDGLRLDATQEIHDDSQPHILAELARKARAAVGDGRSIVLIAEDDRRDIRLTRPRSRGGDDLDAVWADDFHHTVHALLTGERDGYYRAYAGTTAEIASAVTSGFVDRGQWSDDHGRPGGAVVLDDPASAFVFCIQNHDQVGNRAFGERLEQLVGRRRYLVAVACLLMAPESPLLFMGQEFAASSPFLYFTDHEPALGELVTKGRREEFARFAAFRDPSRRDQIPDPQDVRTFERSRLRFEERATNAGVLRLHRDLIQLRRTDAVLSRLDRATTRATALDPSVLAIHRWGVAGERLLIANVGDEHAMDLGPSYSVASERDRPWRLVLSTDWKRYSGRPTRSRPRLTGRRIVGPAETALLFARD